MQKPWLATVQITGAGFGAGQLVNFGVVQWSPVMSKINRIAQLSNLSAVLVGTTNP